MTLVRRLLGRKGMGWIRDPHDPRDVPFALPVETTPLPARVDLRRYVRAILDQGPTSSCVAHAYAYAIDICEFLAGMPYDPPARRYIYSAARAIHGSEKVDEGTYLRAGAQSLKVMGACSEKDWAWKSGKINETPDLQAHMLAHPRRDGQYGYIPGTGEARVLNVKRALASGQPVVFGTSVTNDFLDFEGPRVIECPPPDANFAGGHAMCICGYDADGFMVVNSWTRDWRSLGFAWLTPQYIASSISSDFWAVFAWKSIVEARARKAGLEVA